MWYIVSTKFAGLRFMHGKMPCILPLPLIFGRTLVRPYNALPSNALQWPLQKGADYCVKEA